MYMVSQPASHSQDRSRIAELRTFAFRPGVDMAQAHHNLTIGVELDMGAIHGARCRTFEVDSFSVVAAAMARALELAFAGDPVRSTAEMGADRGDHEDAFAVSHHPDRSEERRVGKECR